MEAQQLSQLRKELDQAKGELRQAGDSYAVLRDCLLSIHHTLSPQPLATALGYTEVLLAPFEAAGWGAARHRERAERLVSERTVSAEDATAVAGAVRLLLQQAQGVYLSE